MSDRVSALVAAEEAARELPMPVIAFFIIAFAVFMLLLGITWSFKNTAAKLATPRRPAADGGGMAGDMSGTGAAPDAGGHHH
ncbi:MAG: hypothetical protein JWP82_759 [Humibacillus sp.]|nr:hypothetical protein [Humibacillus sp.]